ncbi:neutral zinc metallopeptidase [Sphaerisporangium rhizosphaerae]|uniref:Neutral zinc metallopeptidase n=1 Tax=Sphaerisporangium rhizosphaerae TaxID=2269375 RepID=A0ABW2PK70_9ACTN
MHRRMPGRTALAVLLVTTMLAGGGTAYASTAGRPRSGAAVAQARGMDSMKSDIATALYVVDRFWAGHWSQYFTGRYYRPNIFGGYSRGGRPAPFCGGRRLSYDNAYYCANGRYIAWDTDLMRRGYRSGDAWVYDVIAHEWGHAVQAHLNFTLVSRAAELQADCLAGAALYGAAADGTLRFEEGDVREIAAALRSMADETRWTRPGDHGSASQRIAAFDRGAAYGVPGCMGM